MWNCKRISRGTISTHYKVRDIVKRDCKCPLTRCSSGTHSVRGCTSQSLLSIHVVDYRAPPQHHHGINTSPTSHGASGGFKSSILTAGVTYRREEGATMHSRDVGAHEVDGTTRKHRDAIAFAAIPQPTRFYMETTALCRRTRDERRSPRRPTPFRHRASLSCSPATRLRSPGISAPSSVCIYARQRWPQDIDSPRTVAHRPAEEGHRRNSRSADAREADDERRQRAPSPSALCSRQRRLMRKRRRHAPPQHRSYEDAGAAVQSRDVAAHKAADERGAKTPSTTRQRHARRAKTAALLPARHHHAQTGNLKRCAVRRARLATHVGCTTVRERGKSPVRCPRYPAFTRS